MRNTLTEALTNSGKILLNYYRKPLGSSVKESQSSIVTEADFASDAAIKALIGERFPAHNILSEETGFIDNNSEYTWVIDPLDGTSNFASGIPWFGVLITIFRGNVPELAGAFLPVTNELYIAEKGKGAFRNGERLPSIEKKELKNSLFSFCVDYTDDIAFLDRGLEIYKYIVRGSRNTRSTNCLMDFIYVAEGRFGGVLNLFTRVWDIAGLGLLISETGGVMKLADGNDICYDISGKLAGINFPVIAGNSLVVEKMMMEILNKLK